MKRDILHKKSIAWSLYINKELPLFELSNKLNKSLSLVTKTTFDLQKDGWVSEAGYALSSGGRKPVLYQLNANAGYMVVMAMDQFISRISIVNLRNDTVVGPKYVHIDLAKDQNSIGKIEEGLQEIIQNSGIAKSKILGIGIAMPGFIDGKKGVNYTFNSTSVKDISFKDYLQMRLQIPIYLDNDSSVIALAESVFGTAKGINNAMIVNLSWGIGLGIVADGKLYRGENGFAGEFSHIPIFNNGKICSCGKIGCLETETSLKVLLLKANKEIAEGRPSMLSNTLLASDSIENQFLQFIQAVEKRDRLAMELLNESAYNIGRGIAILIHIFNPKKIILSGRGALAGDVWIPPIQQAINEHCIRRLSENIEIAVSPNGHQAELIGAAALVMDNYCTS